MAFPAGTIWHNWSTGATTNGGGFDPTNASFSTDLTTDTNTANTASPVVSSASYTFVAGDVGAWLFNQGGTNWTPGWYPIVSVAGGKATLDAAVGKAVLYSTSVLSRTYRRPSGLNTVAGCATVGTPTGGIWSVDYSQQTAAKIAYTDMVIGAVATADFTSVANPVGPNLIGNIVNVTSGTGFTVQRVQIISFTLVGLIATCDKSLGTAASTGGNGSLGGAIGSSALLSTLTQALVAGNKVFIKATGTYTLTVTTTVTAAVKGNTTAGRISVEGYTTYPGQMDGRPLITSATNSVALLTLNDNDFFEFVHLRFTHTAATRGIGCVCTGSLPLWFKDCIFDGCLQMTTALATVHFEDVEIMNCTSASATIVGTSLTAFLYGCDIHDNTGPAVSCSQVATISCQDCIFDTNTLAITVTGSTFAIILNFHGCTFVDNTGSAVKIVATSSTTMTLELENNIFYGNGGYGIENLDNQILAEVNMRINRNNAYGSNSSGSYVGLSAGLNEIALTADPFTNKAARDFSLNTTAGGGAALRAAAFPGAFPGGTTTSYKDVGAAQHQDAIAIARALQQTNIGTH